MPQFDSKIFNAEVFGKYIERIPKVKRNELLKSGVLRMRGDLNPMLAAQTGGNYITIPMKGLIDGEPLNYDGATDITSTGSKTYSQSMVVTGRAKAWTEKDFSADITGVDFMSNVASQVSDYWDDIDQEILLSILEGVFGMTGVENKKFVDGHTYDISGVADNNKASVTTLNKAMQKACGDNKKVFTMAIMHSEVATNLENLNLLEYLKYTDANGVQRDLGLATWNGRMVMIDDSMPVVGGKYTTYVLGKGAIDFTDCGAKVPYEMDRNPYVNGGEDTLISRNRKLFAPYGISFTKTEMASLSPTDAELKNPANWHLVSDGSATAGGVINHKAIPIARIITLG